MKKSGKTEMELGKVNPKINKKVVFLSVIAIVCLVLTWTVHWSFIIPPVIIMFLNHKELFGKKRY